MKFTWTQSAIEDLTWATLEGEHAGTIAARLGCILRTVQDMQIELGLRENRKRRPWKRSELAKLSDLYAETDTAKLARQLGRTVETIYRAADRLGLKKSKRYLSALGGRKLMEAGRTHRFKAGQIPANKGLRRPGYAPGRMSETQFKTGERTGKAAINWRPIGTILSDTEGFLRIKVREGKKGEAYGFGNTKIWALLNRHVWEQEKGPIPPGHAVVFRNGDRSNCDIDNLELISRAELMRRNTIHNYPPELKNTIMLLGAIKRKVREYAEKHDDGSAQPSV